MPPFNYVPMKSNTEEIRLLTLDPTGDLDDIQCTLSVHSLESRPVYCALSYEWGEPHLEVDILINGQVFRAQHNLWLFLHRWKVARRAQNYDSQGITSQLWIDALCIDQANLKERNSQVQLMGRIYREACGVLVWLGWSDGLNATVTSFLYTQILSSDGELGFYYGKHFSVSGLKVAYQDSCEEPTAREKRHFIREICKKTYWTRRWIVQEMLQARSVLLLYGEQELPWAAICMMFQQYERGDGGTGGPDDQLEMERHSRAQDIYSIRSSIAFQLWKDQSIYKEESGESRFLRNLLRSYNLTQCEELYDRVYALAGLVTHQIVEIDYSIPPEELFSRVMTMTLRETRKSLNEWSKNAADCGVDMKALTKASYEPEQAPTVSPVVLHNICDFGILGWSTTSLLMFYLQKISRTLSYITFQSLFKFKSPALTEFVDTESKLVELLGRLLVLKPPRDPIRKSSAREFYQGEKSIANHFGAISLRDENHDDDISTVESQNQGRSPKSCVIIFCGNLRKGEVETLAITWDDFKRGDILCRLTPACFLILRISEQCNVQIIGHAWKLLDTESSRRLNSLLPYQGPQETLKRRRQGKARQPLK